MADVLVGRCARQRGEGGAEGRSVVAELRRDGREHAFRTNDPAVMRRPVLEGRGMALLLRAVIDHLVGRFDGGRPEWDVALTAGARTPG